MLPSSVSFAVLPLMVSLPPRPFTHMPCQVKASPSVST